MNITILEDLGLTESEIKVYMALLELGNSSAGGIIAGSGLQNSVTHRALSSLVEKGLINFIYSGRKRVYQATDPNSLFDYIDDKKKRLKEILPELQAKQQLARKKENASIYKAVKGVTEAYNLLIDSGAKEYLSFGGGKDCYSRMGDSWWSNTHRKRLEKKLKARQVWDETVRDFLAHDFLQDEMTKVRFLPSDFASFQETVICGDLVGITIFTENCYSILIRDEFVAEGYRKHFELLWKMGKNL